MRKRVQKREERRGENLYVVRDGYLIHIDCAFVGSLPVQ